MVGQAHGPRCARHEFKQTPAGDALQSQENAPMWDFAPFQLTFRCQMISLPDDFVENTINRCLIRVEGVVSGG